MGKIKKNLEVKKKNFAENFKKKRQKKVKVKKNIVKKLSISSGKKNTEFLKNDSELNDSKKKIFPRKRKRKHGREISVLKVIDIGLEELQTWGVDTNLKGSSHGKSNHEKEKKKRKSSDKTYEFAEKKTKLDRIQERQAKEYEIREGFKEKVEEMKGEGLTDMAGWKDLYVPDLLLCALAEDQFVNPTPIQRLSLPSAIRDRMDIVGAAETGSGKTLAFGIPVLHHILDYKKKKMEEDTDSDDPECENSDDNNQSECTDSDVETNGDSASNDSDDNADEDDEDEKTKVQEQGEVSGANIEDLGAGFGVDLDALSGIGFQGCEDDCNLSPDEEEIDDLQDEEIGCVHVVNDVEFDWLEKPKSLRAKAQNDAPLFCLILCPTRELAIQVTHHLKRVSRHTSIKIASIVGGMSAQKQERLLNKCPEIVVATPGRLWELIQEGQPHLNKVEYIKYLVIDEADRMVEKGHFQELTQLLELINSNETEKKKRQTFVFSATLSLVHTGPERIVRTKKKKFKKLNEKEKLEALTAEIGLKSKAKVIDLTRKQGTAETLVESRIVCEKTEKDLYLYYFIQQYPGRTLVFANSKDCIRRLVSIFTLLQCCPLPLHADMHQKQRLKNLDKFKGNSKGLLLATDVAARGLDIPDVQHVIHYQVPRTTENYIHRSGRTARANKEGLSIMFVSPNDLKNYRKIIKTLNRDEELPVFPVETDYIPGLRLNLIQALDIDKLEHKLVKQKKQNSWFEKAAKEMDIELDEDQLLQDMGDSHEQAIQRHKLQQLKLQLKYMLSQPVLSLRFSGKYPTKSGRLVVPYMAAEEKDAVNKVKTDLPKPANDIDSETKQTLQNSKKVKKKNRFFKKKKFVQKK